MRRIIAILLLLISAATHAQAAGNNKLDSLISVYHSLDDGDTCKMSVCYQIGCEHSNVDSLIVWADRLLVLAEKNKDYTKICTAYRWQGWAYYYIDEYTKSFDNYYRCLNFAREHDLQHIKGSTFRSLIEVYRCVSDFKEAENCADSALSIFRELNDSVAIGRCLINLANVYLDQLIFDLAEETMKECIRIDSAKTSEIYLVSDYLKILEIKLLQCDICFRKPDISLVWEAKDYCRKLMAIDSKKKTNRYLALSFFARTLYYENRYYDYRGARRAMLLDSMYAFCVEEQAVADNISSQEAEFSAAIDWANYYISCRKFDKAKLILDSLSGADVDDFNSYLPISYRDYYMAIGDYKSAVDYVNQLFDEKMEFCSPANAVKYTRSIEKERYDNLQRERDIKDRTRSIIAISAFAIVLIVLLFVALALYAKRRSVAKLNAKNRQITDSIHYASVIQKAALPKDDYIRELFHDYFIIYRPLHIVAGDFYWVSRVEKYRIVVCADCTGHGVPGAFVSMLGISLLNEVSSSISADNNAAEVLNILRAKLMHALGQSKKKYDHGAVYAMDGMDLAMVVMEDGSNVIQFAGAYRPLWIWRKGELLQIKPDKMPIGIYLGPEKDFTNHEIEVQPGDVLYMFSDGIPDQFGYTNSDHSECRHFSTKRLARLIGDIGAKPLDEQKRIIEETVDNWKNGYQQLDDNILMGIRI